jgi:hypothetical protein
MEAGGCQREDGDEGDGKWFPSPIPPHITSFPPQLRHTHL